MTVYRVGRSFADRNRKVVIPASYFQQLAIELALDFVSFRKVGFPEAIPHARRQGEASEDRINGLNVASH